jgi:hypothetical protein
MKRILIGVVLTVATLLGAGGQALASVTYTISSGFQPAGPEPGLTGTITTDGNIGSLMPSDILDYHLKFDDDGTEESLTPDNSGLQLTGGLTATATTLLFDFAGRVRGRFHVSADDDVSGLCLEDGSDACSRSSSGDIAVVTTDGETTLIYPVSSDLIATAAGVPEPGGWTLVLVGLAGLGAALRVERRSRSSAQAV